MAQNKKQRKLLVGIHEISPLAHRTNGKWTGFEVELWEQIAKDCRLDFEYKRVPFGELFRELNDGRIDAGFGGVVRNREREEAMDFSYLTLETGLLILTSNKAGFSLWRSFRSFFRHSRRKLILAIAAIVFFIFVFGNIMWLIDRGTTFDSHYYPGVFESFWWTVVTVSTVGYGDYVPGGWAGKLAASVIIVIGYVFFGVFVAEVSSLITVSRIRSDIESFNDLAGKTVIALKGSASVKTLRRIGAKVIQVSKISDGYRKLEEEKADAVVYYAPAILHFVQSGGKGRFSVKGDLFGMQTFSFVFRDGDRLREIVNRSILGLKESGYYDMLYKKWFGDNTKME